MNVNHVVVTGNLTRDGELGYTAGGTPVLQLGIAVNDRRKNPQSGEWEDYPNFFSCKLFGTRAEKLEPILTKGTKVALEGKLQYQSWEKDGQKRSKVEIIVDGLDLMSRKAAEDASQPAYGAAYYEEDVPF